MEIIKQSVELLWHTPNPEKEIESAGRTCYKSSSPLTDESASKFIKMIIKRGHTSVLEHSNASFRIVTCRAIGNEIVRHRIGCSYSQASTRYIDLIDNIQFIMPSGMNEESEDIWLDQLVSAESAYRKMRVAGASPEKARSVLPLCTATEIVMTANLRAWRHFLELRLASGAHPEIIALSKIILSKLFEISPSCFGEFNV